MNFALNYPDYVSKLVVVDVAPVPYPPKFNGIRRIFDAILNLDLTAVQSRAHADEMLSVSIPVRTMILQLNFRSHLCAPSSCIILLRTHPGLGGE